MTVQSDVVRRAATYARRAAIERYAELMRSGQVERGCTFGFSYHEGESEDITAEVLEAAGPETPEEHERRVECREEMLWARIEGDIQVEMDTRLGGIMRLHFAGERFTWDEDAEDDEFVLISKKDGRKFRVEVDVNVEEITEA